MSEQISKQFSLYEDVSLSTSDKTTPDNQERERIARDAFQYYLHNNVREKETATNPSGIFWIIADYVLQAKKEAVREALERIRPIKHKNPPRDDFDKGVDAARLLVDDEVNKIISENTPKEVQ